MNYEGLILEKEAGIATLTLNRPQQLNAISTPMVQSMKKALGEIGQDNSIKVLIITGGGRGFCAGFDVSALSGISKFSKDELSEFMDDLALPLHNLTMPTIAAVNGAAVGFGLSLALHCDIRIASEKALFASGFIRMGLTPDTGSTYLLPRIAGTAKAMELMLTGGTFDAIEAHRIGLVNKVVPEEELMNTAREIADKIARGPSLAIERTKEIIRQSIDNTLKKQLELECSTFYSLLGTEDHKEGFSSFLEKRQPEFKGK